MRVKSLRDRNPGLRFLLIDYANDSFEKSLPLENEQFAILKLQRRRARKRWPLLFSDPPPGPKAILPGQKAPQNNFDGIDLDVMLALSHVQEAVKPRIDAILEDASRLPR